MGHLDTIPLIIKIHFIIAINLIIYPYLILSIHIIQ